MTRLIDGRAHGVAGPCPSDPGKRPTLASASDPSDEALIPGETADLDVSKLELQAPFGAHKPRNVRPVELESVARAIAAIEADLETPVLATDRVHLAMLGQLLLLQRRAFRVSTRGLETKAGNVRPIAQEFRGLTRLTLDTLGKLRFRRGTAGPSLEEILAGATVGRSGANGTDRDRRDAGAGDRGTAGHVEAPA